MYCIALRPVSTGFGLRAFGARFVGTAHRLKPVPPKPCALPLGVRVELFYYFRVALFNHAALEFQRVRKLSAVKCEIMIEQREPLDRFVLREFRVDLGDFPADQIVHPGIRGHLLA
jgi:hypothetical protein